MIDIDQRESRKSWKRLARNMMTFLLRPLIVIIQDSINREMRVFGDKRRINIDPTAELVNTLVNTSSGDVVVGAYTFTGHNVSILTGTHDHETFMRERMFGYPLEGRDIKIGKGVWIGSNAIILGPCVIEDHAVVAAGSIVFAGSHIEKGTVVAGVPAKVIKRLDLAD